MRVSSFFSGRLIIRQPRINVPQQRSIASLCEEQRDNLDSLMAELSAGIRDQNHHNDLEEQASAIGAGLRKAFRKGGAA